MTLPDVPAEPSMALDSPAELAKWARVSARTIHRLTVSGALPHYVVGGQIRYDRAEVREALRAARRSA